MPSRDRLMIDIKGKSDIRKRKVARKSLFFIFEDKPLRIFFLILF